MGGILGLALMPVLAVADAPSVERVTSSCEGGPGSGGFGVTVHRDGRIVRWHRPNFFGDPEDVELAPDARRAGEVFSELAAIGFAWVEYAEQGDMICSLETEGDGSHEVSWEYGAADAPQEIRALAQRIRERVE